MIKFFRHIRKRLLTENKFSKYLLYAVGEIVLVVIGILIALSINNWHNVKLERKTEIKFLEEISSNLSTDVKNLRLAIAENDGNLNSNRRIHEHLKSKTTITKSLEKDYSTLAGHGNFRPVTTGYENLKSLGISTIKNDSLRSIISELYDFKYFFITDDIYYTIEPHRAIMTKSLFDNLTTKQPFMSSRPLNLKKLQNDIRFQEVLTWNIFILNYIKRLFNKGIDDIIIVQGNIMEELERINK